MFKVHERYQNNRIVWIRLSEIMQIYDMGSDDCRLIMFINGEHLYVTESVKEILEAIYSEV
nr:MAG TPA: Flagellar and Swarming motility protein [Caudoviricetes sp.]